jgi:putative addiction module component (TIGR02574 family)
MPPELGDAALALPPDQRRILVEELLQSLEPEESPEVPQWMTDDLARREAHLRDHPDSLVTWEQTLDHIRSCRAR